MHIKEAVVLTFSTTFAFTSAAIGHGAYHDALNIHGLNSRAEPQEYCTTRNITTMDVGTCACRPKSDGCDPNPCTFCDLPANNKSLKSCTGGCTDDEDECKGCGIWFYQLCNCLKNGLKDPLKCKTSATIQKDASPLWVLLETDVDKDNLVTTTELVPGILEMTQNPPKYDPLWVYAQEHHNSKSEALAINSVRTRTHAQIHIHVCERNETTSKMFSDQQGQSSGHLVQLTNNKNLYCMNLTNGGMVTSFATTLSRFIATSGLCPDRVGAGVIHDTNGYTWACATTFTNGPLPYFCDKPN